MDKLKTIWTKWLTYWIASLGFALIYAIVEGVYNNIILGIISIIFSLLGLVFVGIHLYKSYTK